MMQPNTYVVPGGVLPMILEELEQAEDSWTEITPVAQRTADDDGAALVAMARDGTMVTPQLLGRRVQVVGFAGHGTLRYFGFQKGKGALRSVPKEKIKEEEEEKKKKWKTKKKKTKT